MIAAPKMCKSFHLILNETAIRICTLRHIFVAPSLRGSIPMIKFYALATLTQVNAEVVKGMSQSKAIEMMMVPASAKALVQPLLFVLLFTASIT
jgi:hypothetical protein